MKRETSFILAIISVFFIGMALSMPFTALADTIYVDADAGGANNGTSWTDAFIGFRFLLLIIGYIA